MILTRDARMHRIDLSRAIDRDVALTSDHDGRIIADVVAEWGRRHGAPYSLSLTGPAGGTFASGSADDVIEMDALEFCRVVSGRESGSGLLSVQVPF